MFDFIVNLFITTLTWLYSVFNQNIVLAIVAFTVIIRFLVWPLTIQQMRSTTAAQTLQPQIKKLQEKYKNDRERMSQAQMELYREAGVNPLGGCLPLLVQLPILFALYGAILYGLSATPFQVVDLSGRLLLPGLDHLVPLNKEWLGIDITQSPQLLLDSSPWLLALPILVMATTWLQSKLTIPPTPKNDDGTPNPAASMTQTMTTVMPIMYGFFALSFSVGLSIYFIVGNLIGIAQYTLMGKANWAGLLGRTTEVQKKAQAEVDHALIERVTQRVEQTMQSRSQMRTNLPGSGSSGGNGGGDGARRVLTTTPKTDTRVKEVKPASQLNRKTGKKVKRK